MIPVVLLAFAIEVRLVPSQPDPYRLRWASYVLILVVGGELTPLQAIDRGRGGTLQLSVTAGALVCGLLANALIALSSAGPDDKKQTDQTNT